MAARYWVGGTANWDNTAGTKWSTTDGGAGGAAVPTSADDVFFTAASGANTITITATANAKTLICTGFTGTLTGSSALNVAGNVTFVAGMTLSCTGLLTVNNTATLRSGGKTWGGGFFTSSSIVYTFVDDWIIGGSLSSNGTPTWNGGRLITVGGGMSNSLNCNCNITFNGTGTISFNSLATTTTCLITINTAGTITFGTTTSITSGAVSLTYTAGTVITTGNTLTLTSNSGTHNISGITLNNLTIGGVSTITLGQNINVSNLTTIGTLAQTSTLNGNTLNTAGLTKAGAGSIVNGTTNIVLNGTGNWTDTTSIAGGYISNNITINTSGIVTLVGSNHRYRTGTITYTAGVVNPGTSTFTIDATATLNTAGMSFYNLTLSNSPTVIINSLLTIIGTLTLPNANITFTGTSGFICGTLTLTTSLSAARSLTLLAGVTYLINNALTITGPTNTFRYTILSSSSGTRAIFTLNYGSPQNVGYTNATDIDSSLGQTIYSFNGVLSNTLNWSTLTYPRQSTFTYQIN